jgi:predicted enzyme related to lactoylglutathione lyase
MMPMLGDMWEGIPPHWMVYFAVADADAIARKCEELGGTIKVPPTDMQVGRFAVLADQQGAVFSVLKLSQPAS